MKVPDLHEYDCYFEETPSVSLTELVESKAKMQEYRISILDPHHHASRYSYKLTLLCIANKGRIVFYLAKVGVFEMKLVVLHENSSFPEKKEN